MLSFQTQRNLSKQKYKDEQLILKDAKKNENMSHRFTGDICNIQLTKERYAYYIIMPFKSVQKIPTIKQKSEQWLETINSQKRNREWSIFLIHNQENAN